MQCVGKKGRACSLKRPFPNVSWQSGRVKDLPLGPCGDNWKQRNPAHANNCRRGLSNVPGPHGISKDNY